MANPEQLAQAKAAYHALMTGRAAVAITDSNGERVEYNRASADKLAAYIQMLAAELAGGTPPHTVCFTTRKGI